MSVNLHIYQSPFRHESRILKITRTLAEHNVFDEILIVARWEEGLAIKESLDTCRRVIRVSCTSQCLGGTVGKVVAMLEWFWRIVWQTRKVDVSCINCHSLVVLPLCVLLKHLHGCKLIYDTHELETETAALSKTRKWVSKRVERWLLPNVDSVIVVGERIRNWYVSEYDRDDVEVIRNVPRLVEQATDKKDRLRKELGISKDDLVFLYQGLIDAGRGIEVLLNAFTRLPADRHIVFMGYGPLVERVQAMSKIYSNIHFRSAVSPDLLHLYTSSADVGLSIIENVSLSYHYCLPNKVFEYLHAGIPSVVSDFPEMGEFVDREQCGWKVAVDENSIQKLLCSMSRDEIVRKHLRCQQGRFKHHWQAEEERMLSIYDQLFDLNRETGLADRRLAS